jgi:hypothetical protein
MSFIKFSDVFEASSFKNGAETLEKYFKDVEKTIKSLKFDSSLKDVVAANKLLLDSQKQLQKETDRRIKVEKELQNIEKIKLTNEQQLLKLEAQKIENEKKQAQLANEIAKPKDSSKRVTKSINSLQLAVLECDSFDSQQRSPVTSLEPIILK